MTIEQLKAAHRSTPFRPFTIRMADGRMFPIPHPDFMWMSPSSRTVIVVRDDDSFSILDLLQMTEMQMTEIEMEPNVRAN